MSSGVETSHAACCGPGDASRGCVVSASSPSVGSEPARLHRRDAPVAGDARNGAPESLASVLAKDEAVTFRVAELGPVTEVEDSRTLLVLAQPQPLSPSLLLQRRRDPILAQPEVHLSSLCHQLPLAQFV